MLKKSGSNPKTKYKADGKEQRKNYPKMVIQFKLVKE